MESFDVIIIGAGQAGLAAGHYLQGTGYRFQILEAGERASGAWRGYYDSLTLFSPAKYSSLPGRAFPGDPDRYPKRDEVADYLEGYAAHFKLPIQYGRRVEAVQRNGERFMLRCADGSRFQASAVIVASGAFGTPYTPAIPGLDRFQGRQLHSGQYRNPADFTGKRVVVIGGANSGVQIAHELAPIAKVTLASRRPIKFFPQRILGLDFHFWLSLTRLERTRWLDDQSTPVLDDGSYQRAIKAGVPERRPMFREATENGVVWADGRHERVDALLFATGFRPHAPYLANLGVMEADGGLRQQNGIAIDVPGLYFVGLSKQRNFASATLRGVGPDAAYIVDRISLRLKLHPFAHRREAAIRTQ
ncbi:monooxygenase [Chitinimonas arctica]|uniref:Monooxygenase n=1 Tax=Chitinimonas arctica TaxID=2594795 RepID=A0A516SD61_9NEIS|nr:NAD(P)-binding domain-containing protein [Chitinimonas arctica]QDQ26086.1 monooxygenase [Chitinimonas arctica]